MADQKLIEFITQRLKDGEDRIEVRNSLITKGWKNEDIQDAFRSIPKSDSGTGKTAQEAAPISPASHTPKKGRVKRFVVTVFLILLNIGIAFVLIQYII